MTPLRGQNVYSADGTEFLGEVDFARESVPAQGFFVWFQFWRRGKGWSYTRVLEWDRALGGWLAL